MLAAFWNTVAGKLKDRWASIVVPSLVFWAFGVLAWAYAGPGWLRLTEISDLLTGRQVAAKVVTILIAAMVVMVSGIVVQRLTTPVLLLLEGYWPSWMRPLSALLRRRILNRRHADDSDWQQLQRQFEAHEPTPEQASRLAELEVRRRYLPVRDEEVLPTRIGNILRAAETRPYYRYGIEAVAIGSDVLIWPRLWLVLPEFARQEITVARMSLDASVAVVVWAFGFIAFTPLAWWAAPVGIGIAAAAINWWVPSHAAVFAGLTQATYDLYRGALYQQLRWPLPANPAQERAIGRELLKYLARGSDEPYPEFTPPP